MDALGVFRRRFFVPPLRLQWRLVLGCVEFAHDKKPIRFFFYAADPNSLDAVQLLKT